MSTDTVLDTLTTQSILIVDGTITGAIDSVPANGSANTSFDHDWYKVTLQAGHSYYFSAVGTSDSFPNVLFDLRSASGELITDLVEGVPFPGGFANGQIVFTSNFAYIPSASGDYFFEVSAGGDQSLNLTGTYQVTVVDNGVLPTPTPAPYTVIHLQVPSPTSSAQGINSRGDIVGYYGGGFGGIHGFVYHSGVYTTLDNPAATGSTFANGINNVGDIVGVYGSDQTGHGYGFLYSDGIYHTLDPAGTGKSVASGINDADEVVGYFDDGNGAVHGFIYSGGSYTILDYGTRTFATGINDLGQVVGYGSNGGFLYSAGTYTALPLTPFGINDAGEIVGTASFHSASLYSNGVLISLPDLANAFGINDQGQIVGYYDNTTVGASLLYPTTQFTLYEEGSFENDTFTALGGGRLLFGGDGHNAVVFDGPSDQFSVIVDNGGVQFVTDSVPGRDGTVRFWAMEFLEFTDKTIFLESTDNANIARLYSAALGRLPDRDGLSGWEDIYALKISSAAKSGGVYLALAQTDDGFGTSIAGGFTQSPEFFAKYGQLDDWGFVNQLYLNVLGRSAAGSEVSAWLDLMHNGGFTRDMVLVGFAESPENITKSADWLIQV